MFGAFKTDFSKPSSPLLSSSSLAENTKALGPFPRAGCIAQACPKRRWGTKLLGGYQDLPPFGSTFVPLSLSVHCRVPWGRVGFGNTAGRQPAGSAPLEPVCLLAPWQPGLPGSLAACLEAQNVCQVPESSEALVNSCFLAAPEEQLTH